MNDKPDKQKSLEANILDKKYTIKFDSSLSNGDSLLENISKLDNKLKNLNSRYDGTNSEKLIVLNTLNLMEKNDRLVRTFKIQNRELEELKQQLENQSSTTTSKIDLIREKELKLDAYLQANNNLELENQKKQELINQAKEQHNKLQEKCTAQSAKIIELTAELDRQNLTIIELNDQIAELYSNNARVEEKIRKITSKLKSNEKQHPDK